MRFLLYLNPASGLSIVAGVTSLFVFIGLKIVRKYVHQEHLKAHQELLSTILNAFGVLYAVLVGFAIFATWNSYNIAQKQVEMEVSKLSDMFWDAEAFSDPLKTKIRKSIVEYTKTIIEDEWPAMETGGKSSQRARMAYQEIWNTYLDLDVKTIENTYMYQESLQQLNSMSEYRRLRKISSRQSTPLVIWIVLISGGLMSIVYTLFIGGSLYRMYDVMIILYSAMNSMMIYVIYAMDNPFTGYNAISSEVFVSVLRIFIKRLGQ